jgi:hypothetical protein
MTRLSSSSTQAKRTDVVLDRTAQNVLSDSFLAVDLPLSAASSGRLPRAAYWTHLK